MELASLALPMWTLGPSALYGNHRSPGVKPLSLQWEMEVQEDDWFLKSHSKSGPRRADPERVGLESCWEKGLRTKCLDFLSEK